MPTEQNNEQQNEPKDQARNLFFQSGLTQAQIAELVGVSQKTVSIWMNEGKWKMIKDYADQAPSVLLEQMANELSELSTSIASREPGKRFATLQEAEMRRKTMVSIKCIKDQQTAGVHSEVLMNFIGYVRKRSLPDVQMIVRYADSYLKGEKAFVPNPPFKPYSLPGQFEIPTPDGLPQNHPDTPPKENDTSTDQNKAA